MLIYTGKTMSATKDNDDFSKMTTPQLQETVERLGNILKNKNLTRKLPDRGKQLEEKLEIASNQLQMRERVKKLEQNMNNLTISVQNSDIVKGKYVEHICSLERTPEKQRYKPFQTLKKNTEDTKPTQLIPLAKSMVLLTEQSSRIPGEHTMKFIIEGDEMGDSEDEEFVEA